MIISVSRCFLVLCALVCLETLASAATLHAKVIEVASGNTLVVTNINRPLRVRLKAIAPPESGQPFSEAAREHLKALTFDKAVFVEYTNLESGYLEAKVFVNGIDIASQMLRDGVAWYDRSFDYALSAGDRDLYMSCEQAARSEKRGLWNDPAAVAPWEFRRAKVTKVDRPVSFPAIRASRKPGYRPGFSNADLLGGTVGPGSIAGNPTVRELWPNSEPGDWLTFRSEAPRFSIQMPGDSYLYEYPVLDSDKKIVTMSYVVGTSDGALYTLMWFRGANDDTTDAIAADSTIQGLIKGINYYLDAKSRGFRASFGGGKSVRLGNYAGKQYALSAGPLSGFARVVSKQIGDQRELFALAVFIQPGAESSFQFLNSLKILESRR